MASGPPCTASSTDVTPTSPFTLHGPSATTLHHGLGFGFREQHVPSQSSPLWSPTGILPPLHRDVSRDISNPLPNVQTAASRIQLPPLSTRHQPPSVPERDLFLAADQQVANKRRRIEDHPTNFPANAPPAFTHPPRAPGQRAFDDPQFGGAIRDATQPFQASRRRDSPDRKSHPDVTTAEPNCCPSSCRGTGCITNRRLLHDAFAELSEGEAILLNASGSEYKSPEPIPDVHNISPAEALELLLYRLRWNIVSLRQVLSAHGSAPERQPADPTPPIRSIYGRISRPSDVASSDPEILTPKPTRSTLGYPQHALAAGLLPDDSWRTADAMDPRGHPYSHYRSMSQASSSAPQQPPQSPLNAPPSARMLPSPTSLNLPVPPGITSPSLPQAAAQAAHFQDLQHQISVKSLTLQTLQREYDSLLQKLERQRTKCAALEKKFEVSDTEINSLTNQKEHLEKQVQTLEQQVEEAQQARDDARGASAGQSAQYMRMIEMAGRLQGKAAEDRRLWEREKSGLVERIKELEAQFDQTTQALSAGRPLDAAAAAKSPEPHASGTAATPGTRIDQAPSRATVRSVGAGEPSTGDEEIGVLRRDVTSLRTRVAALEEALTIAREESRITREAALTLANSGQRTEAALEKVLPCR